MKQDKHSGRIDRGWALMEQSLNKTMPGIPPRSYNSLILLLIAILIVPAGIFGIWMFDVHMINSSNNLEKFIHEDEKDIADNFKKEDHLVNEPAELAEGMDAIAIVHENSIKSEDENTNIKVVSADLKSNVANYSPRDIFTEKLNEELNKTNTSGNLPSSEIPNKSSRDQVNTINQAALLNANPINKNLPKTFLTPLADLKNDNIPFLENDDFHIKGLTPILRQRLNDTHSGFPMIALALQGMHAYKLDMNGISLKASIGTQLSKVQLSLFSSYGLYNTSVQIDEQRVGPGSIELEDLNNAQSEFLYYGELKLASLNKLNYLDFGLEAAHKINSKLSVQAAAGWRKYFAQSEDYDQLLNAPVFNNATPLDTDIDNDNTPFIEAGFSYYILEKLSIGAHLHYETQFIIEQEDKSVKGHSANLSLSYNF